MTAPAAVGSIVRYRLRPDRLNLYRHGRPDWNPNQITPPPPPPPLLPRTLIPRIIGTATPDTPGSPTRDQLVSGVDIPTAANTGLLTGWGIPGSGAANILTEVGAGITTINYTDQGAGTKTISNTWFTCYVNLTGKNYVFTNCYFQGHWQSSAGLVKANALTCSNNQFIDCLFEPQNSQWATQAAFAWQCTFKRCHILHCSDGIAHIGAGTDGTSTGNYTGVAQNITVQQCLFELGAYISPDPGANGGLVDNVSHLDLCAQLRGGDNFLFEGNLILGFVERVAAGHGCGGVATVDMPSGTHVTGYKTNDWAGIQGDTTAHYTLSCFMFSPVLGSYNNVKIVKNWMDGASFMFNMGNTTISAGPIGIEISNNRFGRLHKSAPGIAIIQAALPVSYFGNHYWYELDTNPANNDIYGTPARIYHTGAESTWPAANIRTNG